jgi:TrmH family RNA methyltransferase
MPRLPSRFEWRTPQDPSARTAETLAFVADELSWRPPEWFERVNVVLVEPTDVVNIGGVVRVMANTGFSQLRLVKPVEFEPWDVIGVAHYTQHIVDNAPIHESLTDAIGGAHFVLAVTGKHQSARRNLLPMDVALDQVASAAQAGQTVAVLFGPEDTGFTNAMLDVAHVLTTIPTNPAYPSMNLAQAALLVLYQLFLASGGGKQRFRPPARKIAPADAALLEDLFTDLQRMLESIGFLQYRSPVSTMRSLRVALTRARLDRREASLLRAIFIEVRRFLVHRGALSEMGLVGRQRRPPENEGPS